MTLGFILLQYFFPFEVSIIFYIIIYYDVLKKEALLLLALFLFEYYYKTNYVTKILLIYDLMIILKTYNYVLITLLKIISEIYI